jgi:class 3 adenylate cyclase
MFASPDLYDGFDALLASDDAKWEAVRLRDARADGLVYYGVASTGIYCRPVCPSRRPLRANVSYHFSCDAAERAGFRPCKRCRPKLAPRPQFSEALSIRPLAVLFADMQGFSRLAARMCPDDALALTAEFHARLGTAVTAHGGVVHKRMGDGFMALFGDGRSAPRDAQYALAAGFAMLTALHEWNAVRKIGDEPAIALGIGIHFGMAAIGMVGGERTIIGDTVNVASRLESLTRRLGAAIIVSDEAVRAAQAASTGAVPLGLLPVGMVRLPGCGRRQVWAVREVEPDLSRSNGAAASRSAVAYRRDIGEPGDTEYAAA